ncbi:MAG: argininosuccinate lyase [Candidatus Eisenbacteria bacterium]|nr:argininosuccinate lyase [Candidatus Eisenbacteria bacterium]
MSADQVWRGRLAAGLDPRAQALNDSLPVDRRLWPEELALSRAWAQSVAEAGALSPAGLDTLLAACDALESDLAAGAVVLAGEDVHSAVEAALTERCGDPARRLHTGRSRNDQVSTLLRLRAMRLCDQAVEGVRELERALTGQARAAGAQAVAAWTHLQPAQPVLLAHWWLAHVAALERDEARFEAAREAADLMPLGAGAVAGTPLVFDRIALASRLGFSRLAVNSLDAVGDRDFALEYLNAAAVLAVHLSRLAEDLVLWCSPGFGWLVAPDGFSTGSSLLPQKRNPDLFELARGKAGRLIANAQRLAVVMKGLPCAYQKDLQEDKEAVFDTADTLAALLDVLPAAIAALEPNRGRMTASLTPDLLAVELADSLVAEGLPFRDAHAAVGRLWAAAERAGVAPDALPEDARFAISPHFTAARLASLTVESALARRNHPPGAGPKSVALQLAQHEARLGIGAGDPEAPEGPERPTARSETPGTSSAGTAEGVHRAGERSQEGVAGPADAGAPSRCAPSDAPGRGTEVVLRRATPQDVPGIARLMAGYVAQGVLLPRPVGELYQCVREFHVALTDGEVVACAALRLLWSDLGEVRSLAVRSDHHGNGLGAQLVARALDDARALALPRVIALTREVAFFERCGFVSAGRDALPRKVWTDCVRCPRRHACDEVAVVLDLVPGASAAAAAARRSWVLPIPHLGTAPGRTPSIPEPGPPPESPLPVIS